MENKGKYFFIPDWLIKENSQTVHAYIYILNEINNNESGNFVTTKSDLAKMLNITERQVGTTLNNLSDKRLINISQMCKKGTSISVDFIPVIKEAKPIENNTKTTQRTTNQKTSKKPLNERKETFVNNIKKFADMYNKEMLNDFYRYWVETDNNEQKMRFEFQKTWSLNLRLATWKRNEIKQFNAKNNSEKSKEEKIGRTSIETIKKNSEYNGEY
jgi:uncharacterized protein YceH (UPF0502 family)